MPLEAPVTIAVLPASWTMTADPNDDG
jgi:hypothetical protein